MMLVKVPNKNTDSVVFALSEQSKKVPQELCKSLTRNRGKALADHRRLMLATDIDGCFRDPHAPWQRSTNANTSRFLRQYLPKGIDLSAHSWTEFDAVAGQLNERPRTTLNYHSPDEKFAECGAEIG